MIRRIFVFFCLLLTVLLLTVSLVEAQQAKKIPRIGYLAQGSQGRREEAFRQGLRQLGYIEGQNIVVEWRFGSKKTRKLAAELIRADVDLIVTRGTRATRAAQKATSTVPIVMAGVGNAVSRGFVVSLANPGGNITGLTTRSPDLADKRLELLIELIPNLSRVALLRNASRRGTEEHLREAEIASRKMGLQLLSLEVRDPEDIETAFRAAEKGRVEALIVVSNGLSGLQARIMDFAIQNQLPTIGSSDSLVLRYGALMSYSTDRSEQNRRAATYVDKILKGAKPGDLPVERPTKFDLVINLKTAKQLGITIPPSILYRADKVIK
jgi:putative ABC transport system substrate-binding protein